MASLRASDVAHYFLLMQEDLQTQDRITNLIMQKLCYYAQGFALVNLNRPLFFEDIEHWKHGPVVPSLWRQYRAAGSRPIPVPPQPLDPYLFTPEIRNVLDQVNLLYGSLSAIELRNQTHREPPWIDTPDGAAITHLKLRAYFEPFIKEIEALDRGQLGEDRQHALGYQMAMDTEFMELVELGLADISAGRFSKLEDVRRSLCDV